jgi:asparagine synthase (glutamine-hydrolysing)
MFAFALWDGEKGRLWLVRDRFGVKPLYYAEVAGAFCFASTLPALLTLPGIDRTIDPEALHDALLLHAVVPAPRTILAGIRKVPPAHTMTVTRKGRKPPKRYWDLLAKRPQQAAHRRRTSRGTSLRRARLQPDCRADGRSRWRTDSDLCHRL